MLRSDINLKPIFSKLGHSLEEIRLRALSNIESKLEHGVLCEVDLIQERHLLIRLLEWFNFPSCPRQESVLGLLHKLCKHGPAAAILVELGGVEFFTQLRPDLTSKLQGVVDGILDSLFHLPSTNLDHTPACVYQQHHVLQQSGDILEEPSSHNEEASSYHSGVQLGQTMGAAAQVSEAILPPPYHSPPEQKMGYFEQLPEDPVAQTSSAVPAAACFKFSTFPWVVLTPTDKHVMTSTASSLRGRDASLVVSGCEFLSDVVFQDFPAEVFLQRPSIVKDLLSLCEVSQDGGHGISRHTVKTLHELALFVEARIYYYQDPALYTPKQEFAASGTSISSSSSLLSNSIDSEVRPFVIGPSNMRHRGDGQDGENASPSFSHMSSPLGDFRMEETDSEDVQALQFLQWTVPQFCSSVMEKVIPLAKSPDLQLVLCVIRLLQQLNKLLSESVLPNALWDDTSPPARELIEKWQESMEGLGNALNHHYHANLASSIPKAELRKRCLAYLGVATCIAESVDTMVPVECTEQGLRDNLPPVLLLLCEDEALAYSFPSVRNILLPRLEKCDSTGHQQLHKAHDTCSSLQSCCSFLLNWPERNEDSLMELLQLAIEGVDSLQYHLSFQLVDRSIRLISQLCSRSSPSPTGVSRGRELLLQLFAHPLEAVREQAYITCVSLLQESLGIEQVTEPASTAHQGALFLVGCQVLYQVCCFGLTDTNSKVCKFSADILTYLLQSELLLPSARWQQLIEAVIPVLPVLQGHAALDTNLGQLVLGLLDKSESKPTSLPHLERFRGTLRLLFRKDSRVRAESLGKLAYFLTQEASSLQKLPVFSELDVAGAANLFFLDNPQHLLDTSTSKAHFQETNLQKVYEIFCSADVEISVKRSAAEQLAVMMQDVSLHAAFYRLGGLSAVLQVLEEGIQRRDTSGLSDKKESLTSILPSLVKLLRFLLQHDMKTRHDLAHEKALYSNLLRCTLLLRKNETLRSEAAHLMALLLFDEVACMSTWGSLTPSEGSSKFSLPAGLISRYQLPFKPPSHHACSPHQVKLSPAPDPLTTGNLAKMLRLTWNIAWHGGVDSLLTWATRDKSQDKEGLFNPALRMTTMDYEVLGMSYLPWAVKQCVHNIQNATSHDMVSRATLHLTAYLTIADKSTSMMSLNKLEWKEPLARFLEVVPSSSADEQLLVDILALICQVLSLASPPSSDLLQWLTSLLYNPQGALLSLLSFQEPQVEEQNDPSQHSRRQTNQQLLKFIRSFVGKSPYGDHSVHREPECAQGVLVKPVLSRLRTADAAHFYNLASLESSLLCLMHITARPGWSTQCGSADSLSLCLQALQNLLEVVSAFHIGRGGMSMSYMGRGVTRCAALCLRHLACEMAEQLQSQDWPRNWLFSHQATPHAMGESGLHWLTPLWTYRDTEVRAAGLGIAVAMTTTESGRITMATQCQHIAGGIWGAAFGFLLDQSECSLVRQQAAELLVNLTSQPMPSGNAETAGATLYQGPVVQNEETQVSLVGLSALLALLHHSRFYQEMRLLLENFYPQPAIRPVSVAGASPLSTPLSSQATLSTTGSNNGSEVLHASYQDSISPRQVESTSSGTHGVPLQGALSSGRRSSTPASLLGGGNQDTSSATTSSETSLQDYHSVAAPCLVAAICRLLGNLVSLQPQDTISSLHREGIIARLLSYVDASMLEAYISELKTSPYKQQFLLSFRDLLKLSSAILRLQQQCFVSDHATRAVLLQEKPALKNFILLLKVSYHDDLDTRLLCEKTWRSVLALFTAILQLGSQEALLSMTPLMVKQWQVIVGRCTHILQETRYAELPLWSSTLTFLAVLFSEEGRMQAKVANGDIAEPEYHITGRLDTPSESASRELSSCSGVVMCRTLIKVYDSIALKPSDQVVTRKLIVANALKSLLAVSSTAKSAALEAGLVETLCEQVKHLNMRLNIEALDPTHLSQAHKKKEQPVIQELTVTLELIRNFMVGNKDVKIAAYEAGLGNLVHRLWAWGQMDIALMTTLLALLAAYTAHCPRACSSLACTSPLAVDESLSAAVRGQLSPNSLVHCIIKLAQRECGATNPQLLRPAFSLLATLALAQEARGIMWKSNFLQEFSSLSPGRSKKTRVQRIVEGLWLDLLVNLSFSTDGQNMILKINDSLSLLLEFGKGGSDHHERCAALVIHNLCFHTTNKPKLLANDKVVPFLLQCVDGSTGDVCAIACAALFALLYNSQKAKVTLKNNHVVRRLQDAYNHVVSLPATVSWKEKSSQNLHSVLALLRT